MNGQAPITAETTAEPTAEATLVDTPETAIGETTETAFSETSETIIFGADWCGDCRRAKRVFESAAAPYRYVDLIADPSAADVARDISGHTNIPVILYADGSFQVEPSNVDMQNKIGELGLATNASE